MKKREQSKEVASSPSGDDFFTAVLHVVIYGGAGAGISYWALGDATLGAILGVGVYLSLGLALMSEDILEIKKGMVASREEAK